LLETLTSIAPLVWSALPVYLLVGAASQGDESTPALAKVTYPTERNIVMFKLNQVSWTIIALALSGVAQAQKPVVYPAKEQSAAQQQKDDGECYTWAKGNSGVDPAALAAAVPASAPAPAGGPRAQKKQQEAAQAAQQKTAQQQQQAMAGFYKAYGACMEGRGYTVK